MREEIRNSVGQNNILVILPHPDDEAFSVRGHWLSISKMELM